MLQLQIWSFPVYIRNPEQDHSTISDSAHPSILADAHANVPFHVSLVHHYHSRPWLERLNLPARRLLALVHYSYFDYDEGCASTWWTPQLCRYTRDVQHHSRRTWHGSARRHNDRKTPGDALPNI